MRGILNKVNNNWQVRYEEAIQNGWNDLTYSPNIIIKHKTLPLHPEDSSRFDFFGNLPNGQHIMQNENCFFL